MSHQINSIACAVILLFTCTQVASESRTAKTCYDEQDRECLEKHAGESISNPNPEAFDGAYFMGKLLLEVDKDAEGAKKYFEIAAAFGGHAEAQSELEKLIKNRQVKVEPFDCLSSGDMDCLHEFADKDNNKVAQYFLGKELFQSEPKRATEYLIKAARQGHLTSICMVSSDYFSDKLHAELDHKEAVEMRVSCEGVPYKRYDEKHFSQYLSSEQFRAYAASDSGRGYYIAGFTSGDAAARVALEYCQLANNAKEKDQPCRIVSIDGEWVKAAEPPALPEFKGGDAPFVVQAANASLKNKYMKDTAERAFAYSINGVWSWQSSNTESADAMAASVLNKCRGANKFEDKYPCKVVNINGDWQ